MANDLKEVNGLKLLLLSAIMVFSSCPRDVANPSFDISLKRAEDGAEVHTSRAAATFLFTSISGIGEADITLHGDQWPDTVRIRLQYDSGRWFHRLESFTVQTDSLLARTALGRSGTVPIYCIGAQTRIDSSAICGEAMIPLKRKPDCIEAIIPQIFTSKGAKRLTISWIDMYRR
jgi:hypothetical protein